MSVLFTIGQVTKMYHLRHDTLRYYDRIGLLRPTVRNENGYRYYTIRDIELLEFILLSRQLDIPIKTLKEILDKGNIDEYIELFSSHETFIEEKIKSLNELKKEVGRFKQKALAMGKFQNVHLPDTPLTQFVDKKILFVSQNGEESLAEIVKNRDLIITTKKNEANELVVDSSIIGFELMKEESVNQKEYKNYLEYHLKGECIVLSRKDTIENLINYLNEAIKKYQITSVLNEPVFPIIECTFNMVRSDDSTIHFANIYIPTH